MESTSSMRGTLCSTVLPSASRQATISLRAEFLAPPARTVPPSGPLGRTTISCTASSIARGAVTERPIRNGRPTRVRAVATQPQAPDRNLAMELVRTTEAAAMAASRWMGRGDKLGADGAAVEAMRVVLSSVPDGRHRRHRRGREGQRPHALQRGADRRRVTPADRHRRRPHRRDDARPHWAAGAPWRSSPSPSGARCSTPARASTWRSWPSGPRAKGACDIRRTPTENLNALVRGPRPPGARPDRGDPRPTPPRRPRRRGADQPAPASG